MNITFLHDLDTGFFSATLKPALQALGHKVTVLQTMTTYLEEGHTHHIDHLLKDMTRLEDLIPIFEDTDYFILRSVSDFTLRATGIIPYITPNNTIFKVHGSELRERNVPYSLRTWQLNWHNRQPILCGPRDPSLFRLYRSNTMQHIERPIDLSLIPRKNKDKENPFALHTPTNTQRKGTDELLQSFNRSKGNIQLHIISGVPRKKILKLKAKASYFIDHLGTYPHGPYGMNSVEAMLLRIPVFSNIRDIDMVVCPILPEIITPLDHTTIARVLNAYTYDARQVNKAYKYARTTHDSHTIAQQYVHLLRSL